MSALGSLRSSEKAQHLAGRPTWLGWERPIAAVDHVISMLRLQPA